ncbi:kinase-like domain-containing protein [Boletus edulis BED1]|uniref:non-specific serine/threonine protein kinase n=1 Tax=Boletus edulis BED1 TaxID=1328754 RepID=A0AAD4BL08_BOLED|nr:kinase-like domain-containing protein [Boletus edulis BED1]
MSDEYPRVPRKHREDDPKMIGLWKVGRTIGKGSSGRVRIARHAKTGQYAAVKIVSKQHLNNNNSHTANTNTTTTTTTTALVRPPPDTPEHMRLSIEREIVIMKLIEHPNVMRLYDVWETSSDLYLILEYVEGGELFDYLCTRGRLAPSEARACFQQIIAAIDYCHRFGVAHRDLKPENLLRDREGNIKVADFGMAAWQTGAREGLLQTACGSPHYAAPEVVMGRAYDGRASDIWSCGVILFALLAGRLPFDDEDLGTLLDKVKSGRYEMPKGIEPDARDLIERMLQRDVEKRITMPEILVHPFFVSSEPRAVNRDMPDLDALAKPIKGTEEIDQDIFANLRTLWHGTPEEDILEALRSEAPNWQKGVYHLLIQYRNKRLENYDEEEELMARAGRKRSRKASSAGRDPGSNEHGMVRTTSQATDLGRSPSTLPPRAAPPTPRRAVRRNIVEELAQLGAPQIVLHSPTPPRPGTMHSPSPSRYSTTSPLSPNLPALTVPDVKDDKMQQFFQQIVEHLNAMEIRAGMTSPPVSPRLLSGPLSTPITSMEFERQRRQPVYDLNRGAHSPRDLLGPVFGSTSPNVENRRQELTYHAGQFGELDKENGHSHGANTVGIVKKSSLRNSDTNARKQPLRVKIVEPSPQKLKKRKSVEISTPTTTVSPAWSDSSFTLPSTPRRRWLGNVFKFKPASYQLLSVHDAFTSREECRRLLVGIGVKVVLTLSEGSGILKCRFDETRDPAVIKAVRFRVEIREATMQQVRAGFQVALQLIQERGASSSFQIICQRLRSVWELDLILSPMGVHSPMFSPQMTDGGRFAEMMVYRD